MVPDKVLYGPKRGFSVPYEFWLRTSMRDFMYDNINSVSCFTPEVGQMMDEHVKGVKNHGKALWKLLNLALWLKKKGLET